jgi:hypothetical protein
MLWELSGIIAEGVGPLGREKEVKAVSCLAIVPYTLLIKQIADGLPTSY